MKKVGFIDYYLDETARQQLPRLVQAVFRRGNGSWRMPTARSIPPRAVLTTDAWCEKIRCPALRHHRRGGGKERLSGGVVPG